MKEQYKFSIVTAVYNVEAFLAEMIDSVVNQTIGLEHIQLILVNDGSTDGSGTICDRYGQQYPDNIVVIHKENGGVSTARNEGLKYVRGELVNFLDSDDKLSEETLENVCRFYQEHKGETDLISIPMCFFDGQTGEHILNYKFNEGTRVVDLDEEWENPQLSLSSAFVSWKAFQGLQFDRRLKYAEDGQLCQKVLVNKHTMGLVKEATYFYRRRSVGQQSAIQASTMRKAWYNDYLTYFSLNVMEYCRKHQGYVPLFVQNTVMYDLQWRIKLKQIPPSVLTEEEEKNFISLIKTALQSIDDEVILRQRNIFREHKLFALRLKHGESIICSQLDNDLGVTLKNSIIYKVSSFPVRLEFIEVTKNDCRLDGIISLYYRTGEDIRITAVCNGNEFQTETFQNKEDVFALGEKIMGKYAFQIRIPLTEKSHIIQLYIQMGGQKIYLKNLSAGKFFPASDQYQSFYYTENGWKVRLLEHSLHVARYTKNEKKNLERSFCKELWKANTLGTRKAVVARMCYRVFKFFQRRPIWILTDRVNKADDNGEALFRYLVENHSKERRYYFAISKGVPDYKRMKKVGKVVPFLGWRYKMLTLLADAVISSQAEDYIYNPFMNLSEPYKDLQYKVKFVFLQHGVTKDDLSGWLHRYNKNIAMFVTTTNPEYNSILTYPYGYDDKVVKLTGFPRYDRLYQDEKKERYITIVPTWRAYLVSGMDAETGLRTLKSGFEQSQYYQMYSSLLNHKRLFDEAERLGYQVRFLNHPNMSASTEYMQGDPRLVWLSAEEPYRKLFAESDLLVTDYSSVAFDFAYLRKPVLYYQADVGEFFSGVHTYGKGYFDYERDGFGEVKYDADSLAECLIGYMNEHCALKSEYRNRIDQTFPYNDRNNCQRVYERIMELEQENER